VLTQPANQTAMIGDIATIAVSAGGTPPFSYQWRLNGADIPTASGSSLALTDVQLSQAGNYEVIVSNNCGSVTSAVATLTVLKRADLHFDFETLERRPVWLGTTQMVQNTSASYRGTNAIALAGYPHGYVRAEVPQGTRRIEFYFYDDYGPNPPLYAYMLFWLVEATNSPAFAGFTMNDGGWGTIPPRTMNHYYAYGDEEYSTRTMGPLRTVGWHKFAFLLGSGSVAMSVDDTPVFETNTTRVARYLQFQSSLAGGWGRVDDLVFTGVAVEQPKLALSRSGDAIRIAWPAFATGFVLQETSALSDNWTNSSAIITVEGSENVATIVTTGTSRFYRLRK